MATIELRNLPTWTDIDDLKFVIEETGHAASEVTIVWEGGTPVGRALFLAGEAALSVIAQLNGFVFTPGYALEVRLKLDAPPPPKGKGKGVIVLAQGKGCSSGGVAHANIAKGAAPVEQSKGTGRGGAAAWSGQGWQSGNTGAADSGMSRQAPAAKSAAGRAAHHETVADIAGDGAGSLQNCVGAGRIDGWFVKSKSQVCEQGTGHVQSYCFDGNLAFRLHYSPLLTDQEFSQKDPVTFEVAIVHGQCEAVSLALPGQEAYIPHYNGDAPWEKAERDETDRGEQDWSKLDSKTKSRKRKEAEIEDGRGLFFACIGPDIDEDGLKTLAESVGRVRSVKIFWDFETWASKGCGKVFYETTEEAERALSELNRYPLNGRPIKVERLGQPSNKRNNAAKEQDLSDEAPKLLPLSMFNETDGAQSKLELCVAAFEDLMENHDPESTGRSMIFMIRSLVKEVNNVLADETEALQQFGWALKKNTWFAENDQIVRWQASKNRINISKTSPSTPAWRAWQDQQRLEQQQEQQQQLQQRQQQGWQQQQFVPISLLNPGLR